MLYQVKFISKREDIKFALQMKGYMPNKNGLMRFQREHGLPVTGFVDTITYNKLGVNDEIELDIAAN